jgi:hypothetical protein
MTERVAIAVYSTCFLYGTLAHIMDLVRGGWLADRSAPFAANIFWLLLTLLDPLVVVLLIYRRRLGLLLAASIMVLDVAVNSYVRYAAAIVNVQRFLPLQAQTLFCGFVLGSIGFLWRASCEPSGMDTQRTAGPIPLSSNNLSL